MTETTSNPNPNPNPKSVSMSNVGQYIFSNIPIQLNRMSVLKDNHFSFSCLIANMLSILDYPIYKGEYTSKPLPYRMEHVAIENTTPHNELVEYILRTIINSSVNGDTPKKITLFLFNENEVKFEISYNDYWFHKPLPLLLRKNLAIMVCGMLGVDNIRIDQNRINIIPYPLEYFRAKYSKRQRKILALNFMNILDISEFEVSEPIDR